ncbi:MAG: hypothetical protein ACSLFQ_18285, partial [Thermoanaerobaculia bacterium]
MIPPPDGIAWGEALRLVGVLLGASLFLAMRREDESPALRNLAIASTSLFASSALLLCAWTGSGSIPRWGLAALVASAAALAALRAPLAIAGIRIASIDRRRATLIATGAGLAAFAAVATVPVGGTAAIAIASLVDALALGAVALT